MAVSSTPASEQGPSSNSEVKVEGSCNGFDEKCSNPSEQHTPSPPPAPVEKKKKKRNESPGVRVIGSRVYDSQNGKSCHQCRQKTMDIMAPCKSWKKEKQCTIKYCHKCLVNRYGEKAEEVAVLDEWFCPKCRGICNCSFCRKKNGQKPTGILVHAAKSTGFSSVSEMLLNGSDIQSVKDLCHLKQRRNSNMKPDEEKAKKRRRKSDKNTEGVHEDQSSNPLSDVEIPLPQGSELTTVANIELQHEEVGHALQFLEFCASFGVILELKKDEAENILCELIRRGGGCIGKSSPVAQLFVRLLSLIQTDSGESSSSITHKLGHKSSWLLALHKCISSSSYLSGILKLDKFDGGPESFDSLNSIERLKLINFVCDEVLCTNTIRSWMDQQKVKCSEKVKETKEKFVAAKQKEKQLKQKMKNELAEAVIAKNGVPLTISEHTAIVSEIKVQTAQAHAEMLESKGRLSTGKQQCISVSTKPILVDNAGRRFWRLKGCGDESNILLQEASHPDEPEFSEKWFTYKEEEQVDKIKKYISFKEKEMKRCEKVLSVNLEDETTTSDIQTLEELAKADKVLSVSLEDETSDTQTLEGFLRNVKADKGLSVSLKYEAATSDVQTHEVFTKANKALLVSLEDEAATSDVQNLEVFTKANKALSMSFEDEAATSDVQTPEGFTKTDKAPPLRLEDETAISDMQNLEGFAKVEPNLS